MGLPAWGWHCLAVTMDGRVIGWGGNRFNDHGQTAIPSGLTDIACVAAGRCFSLALRKDGTVAAWGDNCLAKRRFLTAWPARRPSRPAEATHSCCWKMAGSRLGETMMRAR